MHTAATLAAPGHAVRPCQCIGTEPAGELRTSRVRRLGHLSHSLADLEPGACGQVVNRQVEIDDQLVAGKLSAIALTRDGLECTSVDDCDLA